MIGDLKVKVRSGVDRVSIAWNLLLSTELSRSIDSWIGNAAQSSASVYDKAMDATYNLFHLGGGEHRLFDHAHDAWHAWIASKNALTDDSLAQELSGYLSALWKDVTTPNGLPVLSFDKDTFDAIAKALHGVAGIDRGWLADIASYTATELVGGTIGALALILGWKAEDVEKFSATVASVSVAAAASANPLLAVVVLVGLARGYEVTRRGGDHAKAFRGFSKGGLSSGLFVLTSAALPGPAWIGIVLGLVMFMLVRHTYDPKKRRFARRKLRRAIAEGQRLFSSGRWQEMAEYFTILRPAGAAPAAADGAPRG